MKHNKITGSSSTYWPALGVQVADMDSIAKQFHLILTEALLKTPVFTILRPQPPRQSQNYFYRVRRCGGIARVKMHQMESLARIKWFVKLGGWLSSLISVQRLTEEPGWIPRACWGSLLWPLKEKLINGHELN